MHRAADVHNHRGPGCPSLLAALSPPCVFPSEGILSLLSNPVPMTPEQQDYLQSLSLLIKPASADCNLRCEYCFYLPKRELYPRTKRHAMSREVMHTLIGQYMQMAGGNPSFGWQGGEPTTLGIDFFRRVVALQAQKAKPGQAISNGFQTNGILIDDEWARLFARYNFLVGLSLDGPEELHNHYRRDGRRHGTFEQVIRAAEVLRRNDVEFNILCMVTSYSAHRANETWDFFLRQKLGYLQFIPCVEFDRDGVQAAPYSCTPEQYGTFLCEAFDRWAEEDVPSVYCRTFNDLLSAYMGNPAPTCIFRPACGDYLLLEHNGDVYPCDFFVEPQWLLGNVMDTPLVDIALSDRFREFREAKSGGCGEQCGECRWLTYCYGGCQRHRPGAAPDAGRPNYFCTSYRMLFEHADERLNAMAKRVR